MITTTVAPAGHIIEVQDYHNLTLRDAVTLMTVFEKALKEMASTSVKWAKMSTAQLTPQKAFHLGDFDLEIRRMDVNHTVNDTYFDLYSEWQGYFARGNQHMRISGTVDG